MITDITCFLFPSTTGNINIGSTSKCFRGTASDWPWSERSIAWTMWLAAWFSTYFSARFVRYLEGCLRSGFDPSAAKSAFRCRPGSDSKHADLPHSGLRRKSESPSGLSWHHPYNRFTSAESKQIKRSSFFSGQRKIRRLPNFSLPWTYNARTTWS